MSIESIDYRISHIDDVIKKHQEKHGENADTTYIHNLLDSQDQWRLRRHQMIKSQSEANLRSHELKKHPLRFLRGLFG